MENNITGMSNELMDFITTLPAEKRMSNVYEIICEDKDGNVTDRKFGVNAFTDKAFSAEIVNNGNIDGEWTNYYGLAFVFGDGHGVPTASDDDLFHKVTGLPAYVLTVIGTSSCDEYLNTFDSVNNVIIGRRKTGQVVMDYNYDGIDENINITEFGEYGRTSNDSRVPVMDTIDWTKKPMHTHCLDYDANHDPSYFTKKIDEKVTVKIFRANIVHCEIFNTFDALLILPVFATV